MSALPSLAEKALRIAEQSEHDPLKAARHGPQLVKVLRELQTHASALQHTATAVAPEVAQVDWPIAALGVTHIVRVKNIEPLAAPVVGGPPTIQGPIRIEWPGGTGLVRSLFAGTTDGARANLSRLSVRITVNGTDELITNGEEEAFLPLIALQAENHNWLRLRDYEVTAAQRWTVHFAYEGPGGPPLVTPFLVFGYARTSET